MFKRTFFLVVGLGAGVALGVYAIRKIEETQRKLTPEHLAGTAAARAGSLQARIADAVAEGKAAAAAKESELRAVYRTHPIPTAEP